ncbi:hypothetical protein KP79_PYT07679 [Mizuhopecten yessoensis]|uniref:Uncharacterized protein n=1 Tax=Mizuhopecten yessoensis TaxID=6573 RepID=A0A210QD43_MIZYE|nr:hypothetical protein KP79_PYT07679 [Mizuhopecten yessoensis]
MKITSEETPEQKRNKVFLQGGICVDSQQDLCDLSIPHISTPLLIGGYSA